MSNENRTLDFYEALRLMIQTEIGRVHFGMPAKVVSYDAVTQRASVKPVIKQDTLLGDYQDFPIINDAPVKFPRGGGFSVTWPLKEGDIVWLQFAEMSLDTWLTQGGENIENVIKNRGDLTDAIIDMGVYPDGEVLNNATLDEICIGEEDPVGARVKIKQGGKVYIGKASAELFDVFNELLTQLLTAPLVDIGTGNINPSIAAQLAILQAKIQSLKV